jgi:ABC-type uncharacterized transport system permease subunit
VEWLSDRHVFLLAVVLYGISMVYSIFLWRKGFRRDSHVNYLLILGGFIFHTTAMLRRGFDLKHCPVSNLYEATTFVMWTIVAVYLVVGISSRLRFLGAFASPFLFGIGIFALMPSLDSGGHFDVILSAAPVEKKQEIILAVRELKAGRSEVDAKALVEAAPAVVAQGLSKADAAAIKQKLEAIGAQSEVKTQVPGVVTSLHAALMALAYGAFALSAIAAIMFLSQERKLKFNKLQAILSLMPPIQRLEAAAGRLMIGGFMLLTLGLLIGTVGLKYIDPHLYRGDPKIVWSVIVWLIYFGLLLMRWRYSQGGRRFALGAIGTFAFVLLTFWGSNLLSPVHTPETPRPMRHEQQ